jgi:hypothetical protein
LNLRTLSQWPYDRRIRADLLRADDLKESALLRSQAPHSSYPLADWQETGQ